MSDPSDPAALVNAARRFARRRKESLREESTHCLVVIREERPVVAIGSGELPTLLGMAETIAGVFAADALAVIVEGVLPLVDTNPISGAAWQRGEAEGLWLNHDGVAKGWVAEAQILSLAGRNGATSEEGWPFRLTDASVEWADRPLTSLRVGIAATLAGRFSAPVADASRVPDPGDGFVGDADNGPFYDPEYGRVVLDIGAARVLGRQTPDGCEVVLIAETRERAEELIAEGLPSWQVEVVPAA